MDAKTSEWRAGPNVCRCCLSEGCYKDISTEYFWMGKREVYAEMLSETLSLTISYSQSGGPNSNSRLICELCISRLRDASDFKRQVLECEKTFTQHLDVVSTSVPDAEVQAEPVDDVKLEQVKQEKRLSDDDFDDRADFDDDDDDLDDQPLVTLATKIPKKESIDLMDLLDNSRVVTEKRKSSTKTKSSTSKKTKLSKIVKKEPVKASASKAVSVAKTEKKKRDPHFTAKRNAEIVLQYTTVYPFRLRGKSLMCVYCCEKYEDPVFYRKHLDTDHQKFTVSTAFAHKGTAKEYLKVDVTNLKCRLCSAPFERLDDIVQHLKDEHQNKIHRLINLEVEVAMQPYRLERGNFICYHCEKKLPSLTKLCRHSICHYQQYTCDICGRCYLSNEALKYHVRCNHSGMIFCRKCSQEFSTEEQRKEHMKTSKPCWNFCCVHCGERFQSWEYKQKHLVAEHGVQKLSYPCPECGKTFKWRKNYYTHYKLAHTDEGFQCSYCNMKFSVEKQLKEHVLGHTGEKPYQCNVCMKCFTRNNSLTQHMWTHRESKRFMCFICDKQFAQKVSLKVHMRAHHPDVSVNV